MFPQYTIEQSASCSGIGAHCGLRSTVAFCPAPEDTGLVFRRIDLNPTVYVPARVSCVSESYFATSLMCENVRVGTVEHILSACSGLGIDNLYIDIDQEECPIMDGSAYDFVHALHQAGRIPQNKNKKTIRILETVEISDGERSCRLEPCDHFCIDFTILCTHPAFQAPETRFLSAHIRCPSDYEAHIASARTFGFLWEYEKLRSLNLAQGSGLENAIGFDAQGVMNPEGLRYPNECVRHKILDAIGDLYLLGHPIQGKFVGIGSGHALNVQLLRSLCPHHWTFI